MIITVFRSRLRADVDRAAYDQHAASMAAAVQTMPGFVSYKTFTADDGERVTIVEFETLEHQKAWARHPGHVDAQLAGRNRYYAEYALTLTEEVRRTNWKR